MQFILRPVSPGANQRRILGTKDHFVVEAEFNDSTNGKGPTRRVTIKKFATSDDAHAFAFREKIDLTPEQ